MADKLIINIVTTQCQPQDVEKFNKWYNEVHIPMLLKFKKLKGVARYQTVSESSNTPQYIAVYKYANQKDIAEFEKSPELAAAIKEMQGSWGDKVQIISRMRYELIKQWGK
jgi:antibiotic biosynthesis monooxygenase (ABM) superfamily enzyme